MATFKLEDFTRRLIAETLFYDEEYGAVAYLSLIDPEENKERYIACFSSNIGDFVIEEATDWEEIEPDADDDIDYVLAVDSDEYGTYEAADDVVEALLSLATEQNLIPSVTLWFEDDEVA